MSKNFNNQFATQKLRQETSVTGTGAGMTPSTVNNPTTQDWYTTKKKKKTKKETKDVEPKYAAGKAKIYMKDKWGWKDAPSIPNRPSKGGFIYKQLFEELSKFVNEVKEGLQIDDKVKVVYGNEFYGETGTVVDIIKGFAVIEMDRDGKEYSMHVSDVEKIEDEDELDETLSPSDYKKAREILDRIQDKSSALYNTILDFIKDIYPHDLEKELGDHIKAANLSEGYDHLRYLVSDLRDLYYKSNDEAFKKAIVNAIPDSEKYSYILASPESHIQKLEDVKKLIPQARLINPRRATEIIDDAIQFFQDKMSLKEDKNGQCVPVEELEAVLKAYKNERDDLIRKLVAKYSEASSTDGPLQEGYAQFRNETKMRSKPDQFHQAVRKVKQRVQEINRLFEYVSRLKSELSEVEGGLKYKMHTEKALAKIKDMVNELNRNIKKFK